MLIVGSWYRDPNYPREADPDVKAAVQEVMREGEERRRRAKEDADVQMVE